MNFKRTTLAAAALLSIATASHAVDWGGYIRVGPGSKGDNKCFGEDFNGWGGKYRLGNECNTYGEFQLSQTAKMGGVDYKVLLMTNFYRPGSDIGDGATTTNVNQIYAEAKGFDVAPNQTFWIGRRFYGRTDVHMVDTFFVNMTGSGAGVEGINLGVGKLALAVFRTSENDTADLRGTRVNADLSDVVTNPGGKLRVTLTATKFSGTDLATGASGKSGFGLSFQHNQSGLLGGDNTLWLQYAQGSAYLNQGFGTATNDSDNRSWRIVESLSWLTGPLTAQTLAMIGKQGPSGAKQDFATLGGRVGYALTNNFKLQGELGFSRAKPTGGDAQNLTKLTIAPTLTVGPNYYDRPEFRLYYTHAFWNDAYRLVNPQFGDKKSGDSIGIQLEAWF